ncbi:hypothetical protein GGS20DRAFT_583674 [Poronia punctata]|nr:hypothetical protein GGS20DRAFT_583674 [Poronia punctata]
MSDLIKPGLTPPPDITPNFDHPPNRNVEGHVALVVSIVLVAFSVSARAYSRVFCMKKVTAQDVLVLLSLGPYIGCLWVLYTFLLTTGYYVHQWDVPATHLPYVLHIIYLGMVQYEATMGSLKVAILSEWIQIFVPRGTRNTFFWTSVALITVNVAYYISSILATSLTCPTRGTLCDRSTVIFVCSASINLVSDLIILVLPIRTIWKLQIPKQKKIAISFVFGLGIITCAAATVRLVMSVDLYTSPDKTFGIAGTTLWCLTELTIAYLVFCAPAIPKIFQGTRISRILFGTTGHSSGSTSAAAAAAARKENIDIEPQRPPPSHHMWQRIEHDENDGDSSEDAPRGAVPLQSFHTSVRGGAPLSGWESTQQLRAIRVENHVAVSSS